MNYNHRSNCHNSSSTINHTILPVFISHASTAELERQKFVRKSQASTADSGLGLDSESLASTQNLSGSIDSLAPPPEKESNLKRTALSNSLIDLKEAAGMYIIYG